MVSSPHARATRRSSAHNSTPTAAGRVTVPSLRDWTDAERRQFRTGAWTEDERFRFRAAVEAFPDGPWSAIARFVGTRTVRQTMTHAQKQQLRIERHARGLRPSGRKPRSQSNSSSGSSSSSSNGGGKNTDAHPPALDFQRCPDENTSTGDLGGDDEDGEIGALLDALMIDWVAVYLASPAWLEFETSSDHSDSTL